jgi:hypothetical protein
VTAQRWIALTLTAALLGAAVLLVAENTEIGPVLLELTPRRGVHLGDLLVLGAALAILALCYRRLSRG